MRNIDTPVENFNIDFDLEKITPVENILFLDIETTGFSALMSRIVLIGCAYFNFGTLHIVQWLCENEDDEKTVLESFIAFTQKFTTFIHFNGNTFDIPFIEERCHKNDVLCDFSDKSGVDLYCRIRPFKHLAKLIDCKLKSICELMGYDRKDVYSGREMIELYYKFEQTHDEEIAEFLLLHNSDDIKGLISILPLLKINDLFCEPMEIVKVQASVYTAVTGEKNKELLISLKTPVIIPIPLSARAFSCYMKVDRDNVYVRVPIYEEEMKYFYAGYRDYYYLPEEDCAIHKSVARYVDPAFREQAKAQNCYTKKFGRFLPIFEPAFEPFYKREYGSRELFLELTNEAKSNREFFIKYALHIMTVITSEF